MALVEIWISLIKNAIDIIIDRQHDPKITLATNKVSKYNANTVNILNKKPKAANYRHPWATVWRETLMQSLYN